ncbi:signal peptidase II [Candidatus Uhrbacteria bacterium]|nr:signal peptidase II [Candidatus Uhrbacteria bacterium]
MRPNAFHASFLWLNGLFLFFLILADRLTKQAFSARTDTELILVPRLVSIIHHRNFGIVANIPLPTGMILLVTFLAIGALGVGMVRSVRQNRLSEIPPLLLILAGALGNLWDRLTLGYVFDWLLLVRRSAVNLADISIFFGLAWFLLSPRESKPPLTQPGE